MGSSREFVTGLPVMRRSLIATLLCASFAFQLALAGGEACVMPEPPDGGVAMAVGMEGEESLDVASGSEDAEHAACIQRTSRATPASCALMVSCAASYIAVPGDATDIAPRRSSRAEAPLVTEPASPSYPPEPPPPRV